jgi:anthranilate/para-aminobenzoate synthase component II
MNRPVLVVDFGAQYAQLIARRVREASVYSEIVHHNITAAEVAAKNPLAIILSGGPSSVYEEGSPQLDKGILELGIPVLGICYGFQTLANALGGRVDATGKKEYGATELRVTAGGEIAGCHTATRSCKLLKVSKFSLRPTRLRLQLLRTAKRKSMACSGTQRLSTRSLVRKFSKTSCTTQRELRRPGTLAT